MDEILEIAKTIEFNAKAEAQAVLDYTELLRQIENSNIDKVDKEFLENNVIKEIISDELNHQQKLEMAYTMLTKIKPNKN